MSTSMKTPNLAAMPVSVPVAIPATTEPPQRPRSKTAQLAVMIGCLQALVLANLVQVAAGFAGADPRPPSAVVPGIAATALLGLAAIPMVRVSDRLGYRLGIGFCLASMVGMGPHKLHDEVIGRTILPASSGSSSVSLSRSATTRRGGSGGCRNRTGNWRGAGTRRSSTGDSTSHVARRSSESALHAATDGVGDLTASVRP